MQIATKPDSAENGSSRVIGKQIDLLYDNQLSAILTTAVIVVLLFSFLTYSTDWGNLIHWASMFFVVIILRLFFNWEYLKNKKTNTINIKTAEFIYTAGVVLTGAIWGMMGIWLFPVLDFKGQVLLFIFIIAVAAAANSTMAYRKWPIYSFILLLILPLVVGVNNSSFPNAQIISIAMLINLMFLLRTATVFYNNTYNMLHFQEIFKGREHELLLQREKANLANLAKSDFLSRMSHELRTPLNAVLGMNELLLRDKKEPLTEKQTNRVKKAGEAGKHLLSIVDDVLDLSRVEAGNMEVILELTDCQAVVNESIKLVENKASKRNIIISTQFSQPKVYLMADFKRLKQIIVNLLDNAIKYNKQGGMVSIVLDVDASDFVRLSIIDTGYGIAKDSIDELFKPFSRLDADNLGIDGTGIGLSLCKQLIELMHGRIGVDSQQGKGCCFWIEIPYVMQESKLEIDDYHEVPEVKNVSSRQSRILLVEDNLVNCEVAMDMLDELGYEVDVVNNGKQAVETFDAAKHALILMDCEMPVMDGFSATKQLRKNEVQLKMAPTPIVALTAHAVTGAKDKCTASGMDDFLSKPFSMSDLQLLLNKWLPNKPAEAIENGNSEKVNTENITSHDSIKPVNSDSAVTEQEIIDQEIINRLSARKKKDGVSFAGKVIKLYFEQSSKLLDDLTEATQKSDVEAVRTISHALKSSSINVGATGLSYLCKKLERSCEQGEIESALVEQVHRTYSDVEKALNEVLQNIDNLN